MPCALWIRTRFLPFQGAWDLLGYAYGLLWVIGLATMGLIASGYLAASPISQGTFLGLLCVALIVRKQWLMTLCLLPGLAMLPNRGGWAILVVGTIANYVRQSIVLLCIVLALALLYTIHPSPSDIERLQIWYAALSELTPFGLGWGSFDRIWIVREGVAHHAIYAHNDYLQIAFEFGLLALIPIMALSWLALTSHNAPDWPILIASLFASSFTFAIYIPLAATIGALTLCSVLAWRLQNA